MLREARTVVCRFNNNNRVYTPLSEKCSQSRVFISQCHMNHLIQYYAYYIGVLRGGGPRGPCPPPPLKLVKV